MINFKSDRFTFGKYKGKLITEIEDTDYMKWIMDNMDTSDDIEQQKVNEEFGKALEERIIELED